MHQATSTHNAEHIILLVQFHTKMLHHCEKHLKMKLHFEDKYPVVYRLSDIMSANYVMMQGLEARSLPNLHGIFSGLVKNIQINSSEHYQNYFNIG